MEAVGVLVRRGRPLAAQEDGMKLTIGIGIMLAMLAVIGAACGSEATPAIATAEAQVTEAKASGDDAAVAAAEEKLATEIKGREREVRCDEAADDFNSGVGADLYDAWVASMGLPGFQDWGSRDYKIHTDAELAYYEALWEYQEPYDC